MTQAELAVRRYLMFLEDPESAVDKRALAKAKKALDAATDPVERVRAQGQLTKLASGDGTALKDAFVKHAKKWLDAEALPVEAFDGAGVPHSVLVEAGLTRPASSKRRPEVKRSRMRTSDVAEWMLAQAAPFSVASAQKATGASHVTVRKAIADLLGKATLLEAGLDSAYRGSGRAPKLFAPASRSASPATSAPTRAKRATTARKKASPRPKKAATPAKAAAAAAVSSAKASRAKRSTAKPQGAPARRARATGRTAAATTPGDGPAA